MNEISLWSVIFLLSVMITGLFSLKSQNYNLHKMSIIMLIQWFIGNAFFEYEYKVPLFIVIDFIIAFWVFHFYKIRPLNTHLYFCTASALMIISHFLNSFAGLPAIFHVLILNILFSSQLLLICWHSRKIITGSIVNNSFIYRTHETILKAREVTDIKPDGFSHERRINYNYVGSNKASKSSAI